MTFRVQVKSHEWPALALSFLYFFCVLAAYYVIRPVRDQLGAATGSASLPYYYAAVFVCTLLLTPVYGALVARFARRHFVPAVYAFFIVCLIAFVPLFSSDIEPHLLGAGFFVWVSVFNLFVVSVFWSFMADIFSVAQAKRLFATIALGGTLGAVAGPRLTAWLVGLLGVGPLLLVSAALLGVALACIVALGAWSRRHPVGGDRHDAEAAVGGGVLAGARLVWASPFLRRMAILMLLGDCVGTLLYALLADIARAHYPDAALRTAFYANIDFAANTLQIVLQATVARWLLVRYGPTPGLVLPPLLNMLVLLALAVFALPMLVAVAMVITRAGTYGVVQPSRESLYTRVDRESRYKAKNFIDTAVWRGGDVAVTAAMTSLQRLGMTLPGFSLLIALAAGSAGWVGWRLVRSADLRPDESVAERGHD